VSRRVRPSDVQTNKNIQNVRTSNRVKEGQEPKRIQGMQMSNQVQKMQAGKGNFQGGKKNLGQGKGKDRH